MYILECFCVEFLLKNLSYLLNSLSYAKNGKLLLIFTGLEWNLEFIGLIEQTTTIDTKKTKFKVKKHYISNRGLYNNLDATITYYK